MKNTYMLPEMEIVMLSNEDVISTSLLDDPTNLGNGNGLGWGDGTLG